MKAPKKEIRNHAEAATEGIAVPSGLATLRGWLGSVVGVSGKGRDPHENANNGATGVNPAPSTRILPTFDMDDALMRLAGNEPLLLDLLAKFVEIYSDAVPEIEELLAEGKEQDALRSAHTLKSVAGNISAKALHEAARDLEVAMREGRMSGLDPFVARLNIELNTAMDAARCILESKRPSPEAAGEIEGDSRALRTEAGCPSDFGVDESRLAPALNKLSDCIQEHDPVGSRESLASLAAILAGNDWNTHLDSISASLASYDFEGAMQSVEELARAVRTVRNQ
ncbi:MAG: Hpt domain-containing protein [Syntrophobacter sp.]